MSKPINASWIKNPEYHRTLWTQVSMHHDSWTCYQLAEEMGLDLFALDAAIILLTARQQAVLEQALPPEIVTELRARVQAPRPSYWQQQLGEHYDVIAQQSTDHRPSRQGRGDPLHPKQQGGR